MRPLREAVAAALTTSALACGLAPAPATAQNPGGVQAPSAPLAGGSEYGLMTRAASAGRPRISELRVPRTAAPGRPPRVTLRIDEPGVRTVNVQLVVINISAHRAVITASLGWLRTGRSTAVAWPRGSKLGPGSYQVKLSVRDHGSGAPRHVAHSSAAASLTVSASPAAPALRDLGRGLACRRRVPDRPAPVPAGVGPRRYEQLGARARRGRPRRSSRLAGSARARASGYASRFASARASSPALSSHSA